METFIWREAEPSIGLKRIINEFLTWFQDYLPAFLSCEFLVAGFYRMNGVKYCDALDFKRPTRYYRWAFNGLCLWLKCMAKVQAWIPPLDQFMIQVSRLTIRHETWDLINCLRSTVLPQKPP